MATGSQQQDTVAGAAGVFASQADATDRGEHRIAQFRQYLVYAGTPNLVGATILFGLYLLYGNLLLLALTVGTLVNAGLYLLAYRRAQTHGVAAAAPIICYGMWGLVILGAFSEARAFPICILMAMMPVIAIVPYVPLRLLLRLCIVCTGLIAFFGFMVAADLSPEHSDTIPDQAWAYLTNWGIVICVAVGGLSLWHTFGELSRETRQMTAANAALARSGKNLESRVAQRSTELRNSQALLVKTRDAALASSRHKSVFVANMSHELRTPLNAILGFSQALSSEYFGPLEDKQKEYVHDINQSGHQLLGLINNILDQAKIEAGRFELYYEDIDVAQLFASMRQQVQQKLEQKNITLLDTDSGNIGTMHADRGGLEKILNNLLDNAIKFSPRGGQIKLDVQRAGDRIAFSVRDSGPGLSDKDREHLFEPFRRGAHNQGGAGAGIGLALCAQLIHLQSGEIWADSEPGQGACFRFTLPDAPPDNQAQPGLKDDA